jgi:cell shape-determining protein MreC
MPSNAIIREAPELLNTMNEILMEIKQLKQEVSTLRKQFNDQFNPVVSDEMLTLFQLETNGKDHFIFVWFISKM